MGGDEGGVRRYRLYGFEGEVEGGSGGIQRDVVMTGREVEEWEDEAVYNYKQRVMAFGETRLSLNVPVRRP